MTQSTNAVRTIMAAESGMRVLSLNQRAMGRPKITAATTNQPYSRMNTPVSAFTSGAYTLAEDLPLGTYTVKESGSDVAGYVWVNRDTASVTGYSVTVSGASTPMNAPHRTSRHAVTFTVSWNSRNLCMFW